MRVSAVHLLTLLAALIHAAPLRVCQAEQVLFGSNCHGRDAHAGDDRHHDEGDPAHADEHEHGLPHESGHSHGDCLCERPAQPAERSHNAPTDSLWAATPLDVSAPRLEPLALTVQRLRGRPSPDASPPAETHLPLLS